MPAAMPNLDQVRQLPPLLTLTIPADWQDINGHVNVQYYLRIYDLAGEPLMRLFGIDERQFHDDQFGYFDLEHHLWYLAEMHVGDVVTAHFRFLRQNAKRFHGVMFIANQNARLAGRRAGIRDLGRRSTHAAHEQAAGDRYTVSGTADRSRFKTCLGRSGLRRHRPLKED